MKIFLAYNTRDPPPSSKRVNQILKDYGHEVYVDLYTEKTTNRVSNVDEDNIEKCDLFIGIIHRQETRDNITGNYINYAIRLKKEILVCIHADIDLSEIQWKLEREILYRRYRKFSELKNGILSFIQQNSSRNNFGSFTPISDVTKSLATSTSTNLSDITKSLATSTSTNLSDMTDSMSISPSGGFINSQNLLPPHISNDKFTLEDRLGYSSYAYALTRFLTHSATKSPICISIQAPWGAGKTSIMKMAMDMLDSKKPVTKDVDANKKVTLKAIKDKLKSEDTDGPQPQEPKSNRKEIEPRISIWFNAWKYESSDQVWAGLADCIIRGIANRMEPVDKEWFYLKLHLNRIDTASIRNWVHERAFSYIWNKIFPWILISIVGISISAITGLLGKFVFDSSILSWTGLGGIGASGILSLAQGIWNKEELDKQPADVALGKFVKVPEYSEKFGFVHHVTKDLEIVFKSLPTDYQDKPIIIFIDDLDRCSPTKIAQVIEGINLFLAGEFEQCIFVIAMDTEMVAASLEAAHSEVLSRLPSYQTTMPIGWKFMDKFIQLPIIIPPLSKEKIDTLVSSLLPLRKKDDNQSVINTAGENNQLTTKPESNTSGMDTEVLDRMNNLIGEITESDEIFMNKVRSISANFSINPREIKRCINLLRFYRFLMTSFAYDDEILFDQVSRWILLSLKWPRITRWIYWNSSFHGVGTPLKLMEDIASKNKEYIDWRKAMRSLFNIPESDNKIQWFEDEQLMSFFRNEVTKHRKSPLSSGAGKGLY